MSALAADQEIYLCEKKCLILQLLTGQVTEFDYEKLGVPGSGAIVVRHLLQNCPKIQKIKITGAVWNNFDCLPRLYKEEIFGEMASSWQNLSHLSMHKPNYDSYYSSFLDSSRQSTIKAICSSLPKLWYIISQF